MFYFYTNELHFAPEFLGRSQLVGSLASRAPWMDEKPKRHEQPHHEISIRSVGFFLRNNQQEAILQTKKHPTGNIYLEIRLISLRFSRYRSLQSSGGPGAGGLPVVFKSKDWRFFLGKETLGGVFSKSWISPKRN